jgi:3-phosphoshikimate 1-carboxyvinyltransferase
MSHPLPRPLEIHPSGPLSGTVRVPGDKSISHRALMLSALAVGESRIEGLLEGEDVLATAAALRAMGADIDRSDDGVWRVNGVGVGGLLQPQAALEMGNSGTSTRLLMGLVASHAITATFTGDASLRSRPMNRVLDPLRTMGAVFVTSEGGRLPATLQGGGALSGVVYRQQAPSAQVKSAVLLAGLNAVGDTTVIEPEPTRDHTERMLRAFGAEVVVEDRDDGRHILLRQGQNLTGANVNVPGDPSSAAFPLVAALITPGSQVTVRNVLLNPLRIGLFDTLVEMGADLTIANARDSGGEPVGDVTARFSSLKGVDVPAERAPSMIDEYPILAVAAAFAEGDTIMRGIGEMRIKESDRIALMAAGLEACGVDVEEEPEGLIVHGTGDVPRGGAEVMTKGDHRIAMSHLVLGLAAKEPVTVDEPGMIATSFPRFVELMNGLGAQVGPDR